MSDLLITSLLNRYHQNKMPGLLIVRPPKTHSDLNLEFWLCHLFSFFAPQKIIHHPDITWCTKPDKNRSSYLVDDRGIQDFLSAMNRKPYELKKHFIIVSDIRSLTPIIVNKFLKILEEPPPYICIFLLDPSDGKYLDTLESRAITLRPKYAPDLPKNKAVTSKDDTILDEAKIIIQKYINEEITLFKTLRSLEKIPDDILNKAFYKISIDKNNDYQSIKNVLEIIKFDLKARAFNQSRDARLALKLNSFKPQDMVSI